MKSLTILQNKRGFLTVEVVLAFSLLILFTISSFSLSFSMQRIKIWSLKELDKMKDLTNKIDHGQYESIRSYGDDTKILSDSLFSFSKSDYVNAWGRNSCNPRIKFDKNKLQYFNKGVEIDYLNPSTDIEVRNGFVYLTTNSSSVSLPDFYIIDSRDPVNPSIISSLNTGPGIAAIEVAGPYAFVAQASTINQLQIIDIHNRNAPAVISQLKLLLPTPTTTPPFASSIFYTRGFVYLGTTKWNGAEFTIIDVSNIYAPVIVGQFETNTLVNDIYVRGDIAYLASSDEKQIRVLGISDKNKPTLIDSFSPSGWQTQEGRTLDYFEERLGFGRTVGGFNVVTNYESFIFSSSTNIFSNYIYKDIPGGVYGIIQRPPYNFILTHSTGKEFQVYDSTLNNKIFETSLAVSATKLSCDGSNIYFATGKSGGFSILKL